MTPLTMQLREWRKSPLEDKRELAVLRRQIRRHKRREAVLETEAFVLSVTCVVLLCLMAIFNGV